MLIVVGEIGVEEVGIDVTGGGGIEVEVEVEGISIEVGGVIVEGIIVGGGDEEIRGEEIGVDAMDRDEKYVIFWKDEAFYERKIILKSW